MIPAGIQYIQMFKLICKKVIVQTRLKHFLLRPQESPPGSTGRAVIMLIYCQCPENRRSVFVLMS